MTFNKGDIIRSKIKTTNRDELFHPAIVWDESVVDGADFAGIMLTSSGPSNIYDNIPMALEHFHVGWTIGYRNSYFVNQLFIKFANWAPFEKVGQLTTEGIEFIESCISENPKEPFTSYRDRAP